MAGSSGGPGDGGRAAYEPVEDAGSGDALPADASAAQHALHYATAPHTFFKRLVQNFGWQFTVQLAVMYLFVKGVLNSGIYLVMLPFCQKTLGVSGEDCQTLGAIAATPFALKGAIGVTSDMVVLFGYHKLALIVTSAAIGTTAVLLLAVLPIASAGLAAVLLFCANLQTATCDLLHEGRYSELMQAKLSTGPAIVSFVWGCWSVGGLIASCIVGPVADAGDPQLVFWVLLPCAASILIPTALNFLGDPQVEDGGTTVKWEVADKSPSRYSIYLALILALCALLNAMVGLVLFDAKVLQMCVGLCLAAVLVVLAHFWLPPTQRSCNLYMFASSMLYVNIQGALDYWYTADEACAPHGPHFNYVLYVTVAHVMASVASLVGIFVFQGAMSGWTYRSLFVITTVLQVVAGTVDVIIIERGNLALGIPDEYFYLGGNAVVRPLVFMVSGLPAIVLTSRLVSEGLSSTTYALLAGYQHLGHIISQQVGVVLIQAAGLSTVVLAESEGGGEGGECDWENLSFLVVLCHMVLPLFSLPLVYLLIPDKTMHVEVLTEADTVDFDPAPDAPRPVQASSSDKSA